MQYKNPKLRYDLQFSHLIFRIVEFVESVSWEKCDGYVDYTTNRWLWKSYIDTLWMDLNIGLLAYFWAWTAWLCIYKGSFITIDWDPRIHYWLEDDIHWVIYDLWASMFIDEITKYDLPINEWEFIFSREELNKHESGKHMYEKMEKSFCPAFELTNENQTVRRTYDTFLHNASSNWYYKYCNFRKRGLNHELKNYSADIFLWKAYFDADTETVFPIK